MSGRIDVIYPTRDPLVEENTNIVAILFLKGKPPALNNRVMGATEEGVRLKAGLSILGIELFSESREICYDKRYVMTRLD